MKKNIIWSSDIDLKDWEDYLAEEYPNITDENKKYELVYEINDMYLEDERINLDIDLHDDIIIIADLGLWYGNVRGYKEIKGNIAECLYTECDYAEWYCDRYNLHCNGYHHDGSNHYMYRVWKDGLSEEQKDNFRNAIVKRKADSKMISRYTKSLRPYIAKVYGW